MKQGLYERYYLKKKKKYNFVPERNSKDLHSKSREAGKAMSTKETLMEKYDSKQDQVNNANSAIIFFIHH